VCELCDPSAETTLNGPGTARFSAASAGIGQDQRMRVLVVEDEKRLAAGVRNGLEAASPAGVRALVIRLMGPAGPG
jgi:hypothetical protein